MRDVTGERTLAAEQLAATMTRALAARGVSSLHGRYVVEGLIGASLRGVDTHGVRLFPTYLSELDGGRARSAPRMTWHGAGAARLLDAGGALGLVAGRIATDETVRLAKEQGVSAVAVQGSNHFGAASYYALRMARSDVLGLALTNSDALVAPFGGRAAAVGTNPIALAARGLGDDLFCADFATSQTSYSRVRAHRERELPLEPGWAIDELGRDLTSTGAGLPAALSPLGAGAGHKGEGLGLMVEILTAVLAGEPLDHELTPFYEGPFDEPRRVSHLFLGLDLAAFGAPEAFRERLSALLRHVRGIEAAEGATVRAPGDPERETEARRRTEGIPLDDEALRWWTELETTHAFDAKTTPAAARRTSAPAAIDEMELEIT